MTLIRIWVGKQKEKWVCVDLDFLIRYLGTVNKLNYKLLVHTYEILQSGAYQIRNADQQVHKSNAGNVP